MRKLNELINRKLRALQANRKNGKRYLAFVLSLCMMMGLGTAALLTRNGVAQTYQKKVLVCPYAGGVYAHVHNEDCYDETGKLVCPLPELEAHYHTEDCYETVSELTCGLEESAGHVHTEECYALSDELICGLEESEGHSHSDDCYAWNTEYVCGLEEDPEHIHDDSCLGLVQGELICGLEESAGHTHTDTCYARTDELICGMEESEGHSHDESCYTTRQVCTCGLQGIHVHGPDCYDEAGNLICGQQELTVHVHGADCIKTVDMTEEEVAAMKAAEEAADEEPYDVVDDGSNWQLAGDPEADVENEELWQEMFADFKSSGDWRVDLLTVAEGQLGYAESSANYAVTPKEAVKGYTRYGAWYGIPYGDWCAMFVSFCIRWADIEAPFMPIDCNCANWIVALEEKGLYASAAGYLPKPGDLVFYDFNGDDHADHVGIVEALDAETDTLITIEGNRTDAVERFTQKLSEAHVLGWGILPERPADYIPLRKLPAAHFEKSTDTVTVTVDAPAGAFPAGVELQVRDVEDEAVLAAASGSVNAEVKSVQAVDITFVDADGNEIEPRLPVHVVMTPIAPVTEGSQTVVHVDNEGAGTVVEQTENSAEGEVAFHADAFSVYAIVYTVDVYYTSVTGETYKISLSYDANAGLPQDVELAVNEIHRGDYGYKDYLEQALEKIGADGVNPADCYARFFDISIWYNREQVEPADSVSVSIKLADAPAGSEESLKVVHFEKAGPQIMNLEKTVEDETGMTEMQFTTESFSVYGVLVEPGPSGVNDLDGRTFTISIGGRYMTEDQTTLADSSGTTGFSKTTTSSEAAKWRFEQVNGDTYKVVSINSGKYLTFNKNPNAQEQWNTRAHATLSDTGSVFTVENVGNGYRFSTQIDGKTYYLDEHNGASGPGFAGWYMEGNNNVLALNFTPPLVENNGEYAVIIEHNGNYYCVQNDGSLMPVQYSVEDNVAYVSMANPVFWTYVQENGNWNLRIPTQAATFDYQDLPNNYYYRYIDPNVDSGISEEPNVSTNPLYPTPKIGEPGYNQVVSALNQQHTNYVQNCAMRSYEGNVIRGQTNYIGIDQTTMKIKGNVSQGEAAAVYFARVERVPPSANLNNTVNHIDISIEGGASLSVPLAYGTYYYYVNGEQRTLTVDSDMTLKLEVEHVDITSDDMKSAEITAYSNRSGIMNDAFYVTGYTQNHTNDISNSAQVRLEGSFKVADLEHTYSDYKLENGQWISLTSQEHNTRSEDTLTEEELQARKDNRVYYTVTVKKELTFPWVYEYAPGQTAQLYDAQAGRPLSTTRMVNLSKSFDYWEEGSGSPSWEGANECPPVTGDRDRWSSGHIIWDTSQHTGTGMDFRLSADMDDQNADVVALEITKYLRKESWDGDALHPSATTPVTNQFVVYEKAPSNQTDWDSVINVGIGQGDILADYRDYSGIHGKSITVGSSGEGVVYDYDLSVDGNAVTAGMYYIKEDENSIPKIILAEDGTRWMYISTKVETEYVWRGYEDNVKPRHSADGVTSIPEVAGIYGTYHNTATDTDEQLFNGFLEFYVYNIYKPVATDITIKKVDNNNQPLSNAVFEIYKNNGSVFEKMTHNTYTWLDENDQFTVPAAGYTLTGLTDGTYQIKEITPPDGYVITEDTPVTFTVENGTVVEASNDLKNGATYTPAQDAVEDDPDTTDIDESKEATNDTFTIPNPPGAVLPNTGGEGTARLMLLGAALMLGSALLLAADRRRRKENA